MAPSYFAKYVVQLKRFYQFSKCSENKKINNKLLLTKRPVIEGTGWTSRITDVLDAPGGQGTEEDQGRDGRKT